MFNLFLLITDWKIETPKSYGLFHLVAFALAIGLAIFLGIYGSRLSKDQEKCKKMTRIIVFAFGLMLFTIELYKQLFYTLLAHEYQWYAFPYQFCSVPMYACIISFFIKNDKVRDAFYRFIGLFGFVAGTAVMIYPGDVFISYVTICIHTMIWHGSLLALGVFLMASQGIGKSFKKDVLPGAIVFTGFLALALILDLVMYHALFKEGKVFAGQTFNMFFISPYFSCNLPILSIIQTKVPYIVFLLSYIVAFTLGIAAIWGICYLIRFLTRKKVVNS